MKPSLIRTIFFSVVLAGLLVGVLAACHQAEPPVAGADSSDTPADSKSGDPSPAETSPDTSPEDTLDASPAEPSDTTPGDDDPSPVPPSETEPPIDDDYLIDGPSDTPDEGESNGTEISPDSPDDEFTMVIPPISDTQVSLVNGTLADVEFDLGYTDESGVVYGRMLGTATAAGRMTVQILHNGQEFDAFSRYSVADYDAIAESNAFFAAMAGFDDAFFETHDLAVICPGAASGSYRYAASVTEETDRIGIKLTTLTPANGAATMDITYWAVLIPIEKGAVADTVLILYNMAPAGDGVIWPEAVVLPAVDGKLKIDEED